ncbi:MAG: hypothetical protein AAGI90_02615 [Chlamydiota bacterium]
MKKTRPTLQSLQQAMARTQKTSMQRQSLQRYTIDLEPIVGAYVQRLKKIERNFEKLQAEHVAMEKTWAILTKLSGKSPPKEIGEYLQSKPVANMWGLLSSALTIICNINQLNQSPQPRQFDEQQIHTFVKVNRLASNNCKRCDNFLAFWSKRLQELNGETLKHIQITRHTLTTVVVLNRRQEAQESKNTDSSKSAADAFFSAPIPDEKTQQIMAIEGKHPDNNPSKERLAPETSASNIFDEHS